MLIPGPNNPKDLSSFILPLIAEIEKLSTDRAVLRIYDEKQCCVRVHLLLVLRELPAIAKLCHLLGHNSLHPCEFCWMKGVWVSGSNPVYHPCVIMEVVENEYHFDDEQRTVLWDPKNLSGKAETQVRQLYEEWDDQFHNGEDQQARETAKQSGLSTFYPSPFLYLSTIYAFHSFPIDRMHLLYCNIAPNVLLFSCLLMTLFLSSLNWNRKRCMGP